jgi:hypothetical protein
MPIAKTPLLPPIMMLAATRRAHCQQDLRSTAKRPGVASLIDEEHQFVTNRL